MDVSALPRAESRQLVLDTVRRHAAAVLADGPADALPLDVPLNELGFDSLNSVELSNVLSAETGVRLDATAVFDHPTLTALADHVHLALIPAEPSIVEDLRAVLDRLAETTDEVRDTVLTLLRDSVVRLSGAGNLDSASDEEIFALIDNT